MRWVSLVIVLAMAAPARADGNVHLDVGHELVAAGNLRDGLAELEVAYAQRPDPALFDEIVRLWEQLEPPTIDPAITVAPKDKPPSCGQLLEPRWDLAQPQTVAAPRVDRHGLRRLWWTIPLGVVVGAGIGLGVGFGIAHARSESRMPESISFAAVAR